MIDNPLFYVLAVLAVMIAGISKGGFGGGLGTLAVPLMALVIAPQQAAAIMLPILCVMDLMAVWAYRRTWDRRNMWIMLPGALAGIAAGGLTFAYLDADMVRVLVGTLAVGFFAFEVARRWIFDPDRPPARPAALRGGFWSAVAGFTSFIAHAGGPPVNIYLLPQRMPKTLYQGTTVIFYFIINYVKLIPYALLGQLSFGNLTTSAVLLPIAPLAMLSGIWLHKRVSDRMFYVICYGLLLVTGLKLLYDGIAGLAAG
ncbi:sulfite exporter TauE/SafE family protein [Marinibaculum pumilum]|uniref:Probable membrane transporter protein n=1 Tax=Marinibaculum pumilum TaxID=1766165 RepID=A0ABV7L2P4_9PROT